MNIPKEHWKKIEAVQDKTKQQIFWVYIVRMGDTAYCKIGYTKNIADRLKNISGCNPLPIRVVSLYEFSTRRAAMWAEERLHRIFKDTRIPRSEWFLIPEVPSCYQCQWGDYDEEMGVEVCCLPDAVNKRGCNPGFDGNDIEEICEYWDPEFQLNRCILTDVDLQEVGPAITTICRYMDRTKQWPLPEVVSNFDKIIDEYQMSMWKQKR